MSLFVLSSFLSSHPSLESLSQRAFARPAVQTRRMCLCVCQLIKSFDLGTILFCATPTAERPAFICAFRKTCQAEDRLEERVGGPIQTASTQDQNKCVHGERIGEARIKPQQHSSVYNKQ